MIPQNSIARTVHGLSSGGADCSWWYIITNRWTTPDHAQCTHTNIVLHYCQADGRVTWDSTNLYSSIERLIAHHSTELIGMVTTLTVGCPVKHFIVQDSLFPTHQVGNNTLYKDSHFIDLHNNVERRMKHNRLSDTVAQLISSNYDIFRLKFVLIK